MKKKINTIANDLDQKSLSIQSRQTALEEFLYKENQRLKEQIVDMQDIINVNKDTLNLMILQQQQDSSSVTQNRYTQNNKILDTLFQTIREENLKLINLNEKIRQERDYAHEKTLIMEQMYEAAYQEKKELMDDCIAEQEELKKKLKNYEKQILQLEKTSNSYDELTGVVIKYRDVGNLNEMSVKLHDEIEKNNILILKQARQIEKFKQQKQDILKLNFITNQELIKLKAQMQSNKSFYKDQKNNQLSYQEKINKIIQDEDIEYDGQKNIQKQLENIVQKEFMLNDIGTEQNLPTPPLSPLPDKVNPQIQNTQSDKIPKLDLAKAFKISEINAKKSTLQQQQKHGNDLQFWVQKSKSLEKQLDDSRKNLAREMMITKTLTLQNDSLQRFNEELEARNETLVKSFKLYEDRWYRLYHSFQFYFNYYKNNINTSQNRIRGGSKSFSLDPCNDSIIQSDLMINNLKKQDKLLNQSYQSSKTIFEWSNIHQIEHNQGLNDDFDKKQAMEFLKEVALEFYTLLNSTNCSNKPLIKKFDRIRSYSNPLDYIRIIDETPTRKIDIQDIEINDGQQEMINLERADFKINL